MIEVCCRFPSTVEDGAVCLSLQRTQLFAGQESVIGERIEVYVTVKLDLEAMECTGFRRPKGLGL